MADETPTDMPAPVDPVPGASIVSFPWEAAASAVGALRDAAATLRSQLEARSDLLPTIVDWEGRYRDDFDATSERLTTTATGLVAILTSRANAIVSAAERAASQQSANNAAAEEVAAAQASLQIVDPLSAQPPEGAPAPDAGADRSGPAGRSVVR